MDALPWPPDGWLWAKVSDLPSSGRCIRCRACSRGVDRFVQDSVDAGACTCVVRFNER